MNNAINWFEIPVTDLVRARRFYETVLAVTLKTEDFGGAPMAIFPAEEPGVGGALVGGGRLTPNASGTIVYLAAPDLEGAIERTTRAGGEVVMPKTDIGDPGFIAVVRDPTATTSASIASAERPPANDEGSHEGSLP